MRLVVYFTAAERRVLRWSGRELRPEARFDADDAGLAGFREYLCRRDGAVVTLVADVAGEEFHEEQIPYLRGNDREAIIQRRLAQRFRETRLAAALPLGRIETERSNERLLLASFSNARPFDAWLDALAASGTRLAGVYSTALLIPALVPRSDRQRCIVLSVHATGLRECYLEQERLRFARFESIQAATPDEYAVRARTEIERLAQYLAALRALPAGAQALPVIVIARAAQRASLERSLVSDARFAFRFQDLEEAARSRGIRGAPPDMGAEQLALALAATKPPREQFARATDRRGFLQWRLQRALLVAGALGFSACAAYAGVQWLDVLELRDQARAQRQEVREATERYRRIAAGFPAAPTSAENLKATVQELQRIAARTAPPEAALAYLAAALAQCPQVELEALVWSVKPLSVPDPGAMNRLAQTLEISARIVATPGADFRAVNAQIQRFAAALQSEPAWQLVRSQLPFDATSQGTLVGGDPGATAGEAARFVVVIARPLG